MTIDSFTEIYRFLSNFYDSKIEIDGTTYRTVEHYYQSMKAYDPVEAVLIQCAGTPGQAKTLGNHCSIKFDWEEIKFDIMEKGLRAKFKIPKFEAMLLATGDEELIEGNSWGDIIWGVDLKTGVGENHLGKLLMKIRDGLVWNREKT